MREHVSTRVLEGTSQDLLGVISSAEFHIALCETWTAAAFWNGSEVSLEPVFRPVSSGNVEGV